MIELWASLALFYPQHPLTNGPESRVGPGKGDAGNEPARTLHARIGKCRSGWVTDEERRTPSCHPRTWITRDWVSGQVLYVPFKSQAELLREGGGVEGRGGEGERGKGKRDFYSLIPRDPL